MDEVPSAIAGLIEATNRRDRAGFLHAFAEDATVTDGGRTFSGHAEIAEWDDTDNIGVGMHFELVRVVTVADDRYDVTIDAASRRFSGTGTMHITLDRGLIRDLRIG